jgi:hypothetical protein
MLLYLTVMLKPLLPVMADIFDHEFNEIDHLATIHLKYGRQHVQKELEKNSSSNEQKNSNTLKAKDVVSFHILTVAFVTCNNVTGINNKFSLQGNLKLLSVSLSREGPPPKFT